MASRQAVAAIFVMLVSVCSRHVLGDNFQQTLENYGNTIVRHISQDLLEGEFSSILASPLVFCHHLITLFARERNSGEIVNPICFRRFQIDHELERRRAAENSSLPQFRHHGKLPKAHP